MKIPDYLCTSDVISAVGKVLFWCGVVWILVILINTLPFEEMRVQDSSRYNNCCGNK